MSTNKSEPFLDTNDLLTATDAGRESIDRILIRVEWEFVPFKPSEESL